VFPNLFTGVGRKPEDKPIVQEFAWMALCTRDELMSAYSLLLEPNEVDALVDAFFERHPPDRDGRAMWNYRGPHNAPTSRAKFGGLVVSPESSASSSSDDVNWAKNLLSLTRTGRQDVLLTIEGPTVDLLILSSDEVARRVQGAMGITDAALGKMREDTQRAVNVARRRG
jgi:hypothetical protein